MALLDRAIAAGGRRALKVTATTASRRVLALAFIRRYFQDFGSSPSFGEIAAALCVPVQRVHGYVAALHRAGEILWTPGLARSIRLPDRAGELSNEEILEVCRRRGFIVDFVTESGVSAGQAAVQNMLRAEGSGHGGNFGEDKARHQKDDAAESGGARATWPADRADQGGQ